MGARAAAAAPPPPGASQKGLADALGLSSRQVRNLTDAGVFKRLRGGGYDLGVCVQAYVAHKAAAERAGDQGKEAGAALARRKLAIDVERAELELGKEREQLVSIEYMERQIAGLLQSLRSKCLNFPGKYARELAEASTPADVVEILEGGIAELLTALSEAGDDPALDEDTDEPVTDGE